MRWTRVGTAFAGLLLLCVSPETFAGQASPGSAGQQNPPSPPPSVMPALPGPAVPNVTPRFMVVIDAAHGGDDTGARIGNGIGDHAVEKDIVLSLSVRLRSTLSAHGIGVVTTRESDINLTPVSRAEIANRDSAAACILIHATATGSGVHLYTSSLAPVPVTRFMPWQTAQSGYITQSLKLSSEIDSALAHAEIPVTLGRTSLQPMDSFACPAVAVEVAPLVSGATTKSTPISDSAYQKSIVDALTAALTEWRNDWRQQP
jgi:N-acetylmuramoyl-L-alanine amidase